MAQTIRILLADDHRTVREGLKHLLEAQSDMEVVGEAGDGLRAIESARALRPDVVIMDVSMPQMNGLIATERLKAECPAIHILTLTRHADDAYLQELLRAGASGYVLKQSSPEELIHAVRAVAGGGQYLDSSIAGKVTDAFVGRQFRPRGEPKRTLSPREAEVLRLIALGYSNKEIAVRLDLSVKTVEVHKANAMRRLGMNSRIDIVRFAILQGWLQDT